MLSITIKSEVSLKALSRWLTHQQEQAILETSIGRVFLFHGSTDEEWNKQQLIKYKNLINKTDKLICCHSSRFPQWVQSRCLTVGDGTVSIGWFGDCNIYITQN